MLETRFQDRQGKASTRYHVRWAAAAATPKGASSEWSPISSHPPYSTWGRPAPSSEMCTEILYAAKVSFATVLHFWWCFWPKSGIKPSTGPVFEPSMWSHPLLSVPTCPQGSSPRPRSIPGLYEVPSARGGCLSTAGSTLCEHASERRLWAVLSSQSWYLLTVVSGACPGNTPGGTLGPRYRR